MRGALVALPSFASSREAEMDVLEELLSDQTRIKTIRDYVVKVVKLSKSQNGTGGPHGDCKVRLALAYTEQEKPAPQEGALRNVDRSNPGQGCAVAR